MKSDSIINEEEDLTPMEDPESECYGCAAEMCISCGMYNSHNVLNSIDTEDYIDDYGT